MTILQIISDTLVVKMENAAGTSNSFTQPLATVVVGLVGALIGGVITIWYKRKEINIQTKQLSDAIENNSNKLKLELIKVKDLRKEYELSLKRFDFDQLDKVLDFASSTTGDKAKMIKDYALILKKLECIPPAYVTDYSEYEEWVANHTYAKIETIETELKELLVKYPSDYLHIHPNIKTVINEANYLNRQFTELKMDDIYDDDDLVLKYHDSLNKLYESLNGILPLMQEEFAELEQIKREFIRSKFKK